MSEPFISQLTGRIPGLTEQELLRNYAVLQIFFSTLQYVDVVTSPAYSVVTLLSDIGGALGLMLGATILTLYECAEFFVDLVRQLMQIKLRRANSNSALIEKKTD